MQLLTGRGSYGTFISLDTGVAWHHCGIALLNDEVKVSLRKGLPIQRKVPPFLRIRLKAMLDHEVRSSNRLARCCEEIPA